MFRDTDMRISLQDDMPGALPSIHYLFHREAYEQLQRNLVFCGERLLSWQAADGLGARLLDFDQYQGYRAIFVDAARGTGKTTFVRNLALGLSQLPKTLDFAFLKPVDPTAISLPNGGTRDHGQEPYTFLRLVVAHMILWWQGEISKSSGQMTRYPASAGSDTLALRRIIEEINRLIKQATTVRNDDVLDGISASQAALSLPSKIHELAGEMCRSVKKLALILPLDDVDMAAENGFAVLEVLRNFLGTPYIIPVITGDSNLYRDLISKRYENFFSSDWMGHVDRRSDRNQNLISAFMNKIFPPNLRISLKLPYHLICEYPIFMVDSRKREGRIYTPVEFQLFIRVISEIVLWKISIKEQKAIMDGVLRQRSLRGLFLGPLILESHVRHLGEILYYLKNENIDDRGVILKPSKGVLASYKNLQQQMRHNPFNYDNYPELIEYLALCLMYPEISIDLDRRQDFKNLGHGEILKCFSHVISGMEQQYSHSEESQFIEFVRKDINAIDFEFGYPTLENIIKDYPNLDDDRNKSKIMKFKGGKLLLELQGGDFSSDLGKACIILNILSNGNVENEGVANEGDGLSFGVMRFFKLLILSFDIPRPNLSRNSSFQKLADCFQFSGNLGGRVASSNIWDKIVAQSSLAILGREDTVDQAGAFSKSEFGKEIIAWREGSSLSKDALLKNIPIFISSKTMRIIIRSIREKISTMSDHSGPYTVYEYMSGVIKIFIKSIENLNVESKSDFLWRYQDVRGMIKSHPIIDMIENVKGYLDDVYVDDIQSNTRRLEKLFDYDPKIISSRGKVSRVLLARELEKDIAVLRRTTLTMPFDEVRALRGALSNPEGTAYKNIKDGWKTVSFESKSQMAQALGVRLDELMSVFTESNK